MKCAVDMSCVTPIEAMAGEDASETAELREMLRRAESYVRAFSWCPPVVERYLGIGIGGVLAVFLFRFETAIRGTVECLWVIEGDLPSAYLVADEARDPASALEAYCRLMDKWVAAVMAGSSLEQVFPVQVTPNQENAEFLKRRLGFIRDKIISRAKRSG